MYRTACGGWVPDKGTRHFVGTMTETTTGAVVKKGVKGRVCGVMKALASVAELIDAKHTAIIDSNRSYMIDKKSGEEYDLSPAELTTCSRWRSRWSRSRRTGTTRTGREPGILPGRLRRRKTGRDWSLVPLGRRAG